MSNIWDFAYILAFGSMGESSVIICVYLYQRV